MSDKLKGLYQKMAELTQPECANRCRIPLSCCDPMYCEMTEQYANETYNIQLKPTGHATLKFMGEKGCTVEPYLRPFCTMHTCAINSLGFKPGDINWTNEYFKLRHKIEKLEIEELESE